MWPDLVILIICGNIGLFWYFLVMEDFWGGVEFVMMIFIQYKCRLQFFANCLLFHYVSSVFSTTDKIDMPDIAGKFSRYKPMKCRGIIYKLKPINESYAPYILLNTHVTRNMNMLCSFTDFL